MKYFPLVWAPLCRKPVEAILIWLAVTVWFTLFGLMVGLHATYDRLIEKSRMYRLYVNARLLTANGIGQSVRERIPEFAVLKTIGYRQSILMTLLLAEAAIPCVAGAGIGKVLALHHLGGCHAFCGAWHKPPKIESQLTVGQSPIDRIGCVDLSCTPSRHRLTYQRVVVVAYKGLLREPLLFRETLRHGSRRSPRGCGVFFCRRLSAHQRHHKPKPFGNYFR